MKRKVETKKNPVKKIKDTSKIKADKKPTKKGSAALATTSKKTATSKKSVAKKATNNSVKSAPAKKQTRPKKSPLKSISAKKTQTKEIAQVKESTGANLYLVSESKGVAGSERGSRGERRKHLDERLKSLLKRAMVIEQELTALEDNRFYRCCIFGSARIKPIHPEYKHVMMLARQLAGAGIDILSGGGPGLMEAANKGAKLGQEEKKAKSLSFGISIHLDFEPEPNNHLDIKRHHFKFSSRLDDFMRLSHSVVVTPGGIGTLLELFFSWQLIQVKHLSMRPIVLLDSQFWRGIIEWMRVHPLARGLISAHDFDCIHFADTPEQASKIIISHAQQLRLQK